MPPRRSARSGDDASQKKAKQPPVAERDKTSSGSDGEKEEQVSDGETETQVSRPSQRPSRAAKQQAVTALKQTKRKQVASDDDGDSNAEEEPTATAHKSPAPTRRQRATPASAKSKAESSYSDNDGSSDASEPDANSDSDTSLDETAAVTAGRQQRVRRAAAAASAPSPSAAKTPKRGRGKGNSAKTATTPTATTPKGGAAAADAADSVLFAALLSGRDTVSAVDAWAGRYAADAKKGLAELLTFLIRCCGCRETFTLQMLKYEQAKVVDLLTQDFNGDGTAYPLQQASAPFKNFRRQLTDFIKTLVLALQGDALFDEFLLENFVAWLNCLSSSALRTFRHTCAHVGMALGSALIGVVKKLEATATTADNHAEIERKKKKAAEGKLEALEEQATLARARATQLTEVLEKQLLAGLFVHRYRDVCDDIRCVAIEGLAQWVIALGDVFRKDSNLKYFGWLLNDKSAMVRRAAVLALNEIYSDEAAQADLELFSGRFKPRILHMCQDLDASVVESVLQLLTVFATQDRLEVEEISLLRTLVFAADKSVRRAAGGFLYQTLLVDDFGHLWEDLSGDNAALLNRDTLAVKQLLAFGVNARVPLDSTRGMYLVDAVGEFFPALQDWTLLVSMLLENTQPSGETFDPASTSLTVAEEQLLLHVLLASAEAATGLLRFPNQRKTIPSAQQKKAQATAKTAVSEAVVPALAKFFEKFHTDVAAQQILVELTAILDPAVFGHQKKALGAVLDAVAKVLTDTVDLDLLFSCVDTLQQFAAAKQSVVQGRAERLVQQTLADMCSSFLPLVDGVLKKKATAALDSAVQASLLGSLVRLLALSRQVNPNSAFAAVADADADGQDVAALANRLERLLLRADQLPPPVVSAACELFMMALVWRAAELEPPLTEADAALQTEVAQLGETFLQRCQALMQHAAETVRTQAYFCALDVAQVLQSVAPTSVTPELQELLFTHATTTGSISPAAVSPKRKAGRQPTSAESNSDERTGANKRVKRSNGSEDAVASPKSPSATEVDAELEVLAEAAADEERVAVETERQTQILAALGKAMASGALDGNFLGRLFPLYLENKACAEVVRLCLAKMRETDPTASCRAILHGLQLMFEGGDAGDLRDLARRLAMTFGVDAAKHQPSILLLHREGVAYSLLDGEADASAEPLNLLFLDVLKEFVSRLTAKDKRDMAQFLEACRRKGNWAVPEPEDATEGWTAFLAYQTQLERSKAASAVATAATSASTTATPSRPTPPRPTPSRARATPSSAARGLPQLGRSPKKAVGSGRKRTASTSGSFFDTPPSAKRYVSSPPSAPSSMARSSVSQAVSLNSGQRSSASAVQWGKLSSERKRSAEDVEDDDGETQAEKQQPPSPSQGWITPKSNTAKRVQAFQKQSNPGLFPRMSLGDDDDDDDDGNSLVRPAASGGDEDTESQAFAVRRRARTSVEMPSALFSNDELRPRPVRAEEDESDDDDDLI